MKLKIKLTFVVIAFVLALGLMAIGVLASTSATITLNGTVNFVAEDVQARVTGEIKGVKESGEDIKLEELNFSATNDKPDTSSWSNKVLTFLNKNSTIEIEVTVENLNKERSLFVDIQGDVGEFKEQNVTKDIKLDGSSYTSGEIIELGSTSSNIESSKTFTIEIGIYDKNYSVKGVAFKYDVNLNNYYTKTNDTEIVEEYNIDFKFTSDEVYTFNQVFDNPVEGDYVYMIDCDGVCSGYISSNISLSKIKSGTTANFVLYTSMFGDEIAIKVNDNSASVEKLENEYIEYHFQYKIVENTIVEFVGYLAPIM